MKLAPFVIPVLLFVAGTASAQSGSNAALKQDLQKSITQGLNWLKAQQSPDGFWVTPEEPALSALVISALAGDPARAPKTEVAAEAAKGYDYLLKQVRPDGGIYVKARANYNTAISLMALVLRARPEDEQVIRAARKFVAGQQNDSDVKGKADNVFDGGIGYGDSKPGARAHADLSNTSFALEALYYSKKLLEDSAAPVEKKDDLNWAAAIEFVQRCQNRAGSNDQPWAGDDKDNIGAFAYTPESGDGGGKGKGKDKGKGGPVAMRYYGSISYAGMMSFIYAGLTAEDPRVQAALQWLSENYVLDENPGMGAEGLYYYYHTMAKALSVAGIEKLKTKTGTVDWREALGRKLISVQSPEGSWVNSGSGRWMESSPVLVTAYTVLALEHVHRALK